MAASEFAVPDFSSRLVEGVRYSESKLALLVAAEGWMRSDLDLARERGIVKLHSGAYDEPAVEVLPGMTDAFEALLVERALHWSNYFYFLAKMSNAAVAEKK